MNIIYLRTSTEEQNPQNQKADCLSLGYEQPEVLEEKQSAFKDKERPIFESIKARIQRGEVQNLICWDWDRLFRNRQKLKDFFQFCKMYKCQIHSFRQRFFDDLYKIPSPFNEIMQELIINFMGWLAEDESKKKSERVKAAYKNRKGDWGRKSLSQSVINQVLELHSKGNNIRKIAELVFYWDKNNNRCNVSKSAVHKIIKENTPKINSFDVVQEGTH